MPACVGSDRRGVDLDLARMRNASGERPRSGAGAGGEGGALISGSMAVSWMAGSVSESRDVASDAVDRSSEGDVV